MTISINFNPSFQFDGNSEELIITNGILGNSSYSDVNVYYVGRVNTIQSSSIFYETLSSGGSSPRLNVHLPWSNSNVYWDAGGANGDYRLNGNWSNSTGVDNLWSFNYSTISTPGGNKQNILSNGATLFSNNTASNFTANSSDFNIGSAGGASFFNGEIAELIIYTGPITGLEQEKIQSYLSVKYGITKNSADNVATVGQDERDYFASDGSVFWDYSGNSAYHFDVAGIGRDDNSGLSQPQSKSINSGTDITIDKGGALPNDLDFLMWGNNNAANGTSTNVPGGFSKRLNIVWKVGVSGTPGTVNFEIDLTDLGLPTALPIADYALIIDNDGDFSSGAVAHTTGGSLSGSLLSFTGVSFTDGDFFSIAVSNSALNGPAGITDNLRFWLKANAGTGTIATSWQDQSGNGNDYTTVAGPTVLSGDLNFNPAIEILSGGFNAPAGAALGTDWTTFFISKKLASDNDGRLFDGHSGNYLWGYWGTYRNSIYINGTPSNYNSGIAITSGIEDLHLFTYARESAGGTLEARTNGESLNIFGASNSASGIRIDINQGAVNSENSDSRVGEMIMYNTQLSATNINKIESYLAIKYGISLDNSAGGIAGDYTASDATTLWDASTNASYHNDVAGVGRDDDSALDQQQSKSINSGSDVTINKGGAFPNDVDFILWGNNNAANGTSTNVPGGYSKRLNRVWKVGVAGTPGTVHFEIDLTDLGLPTALPIGDYALIIDDDGDFSSGAVPHTTGGAISGGVLSYTGVSFTDGDFFSIAVTSSALQGPANVTENLKLWLKADAGVTGSAPISGWDDQSGNGYNATVPTNGPDLVSSQLNFNPTLDFNSASSEYLQVTGGIMGASSYSKTWIYYVSRFDAIQNNTVFNESLAGGEYFGSLNSWSNANTYYQLGNSNTSAGGGRVNGAWAGTSNVFNLYTMGISNSTATPNGTKKAVSRDGLVYLSNTNNDNSVTGNNQNFDIGGRWAGADNYYMNGQIAELIVYTGVPTLLEQEKIQSYLSIKYGLTKNSIDNVDASQDERDYFASDASVFWDYSTNSTYHFDVAGIGRDDNSGLSQPKSKSINSGTDIIIDKGGALPNDLDFMMWGNNNAANGTSTNVPGGYSKRLNRVWKVGVSGTPGTVNFEIDLTDLGLPTALPIGDYALMIDDDGDFSSGAIAHTVGGSLSGNLLSYTGVNFSDGDFFSIAVTSSALKGPANVTDNLKLWLKADAGVTGSAPISGWDDQSGNGYNATVPTNGPDLVSSQLNFNPTLDFTGSNSEYLSITNGILGTSTFNNAWIYTVSRTDNSATTNTIFNENLNVGGESFNVLLTWSNANTYYDFGNRSGVGRINGPWTGTNGDYNLWTFGSSSSTSTPNSSRKAISKDGLVFLSNNNNDNATGANNDFTIGGRYTGANNYYMNGQIAELAIYMAVPSIFEEEKIESYFGLKYGISLAHDYYNSGYDGLNAATTKVYDVGVGYDNEIVGIIRDDNGSLHQKQSKPARNTSGLTLYNGISYGGVYPVDNTSNTTNLNNGESFVIGHDNGAVTMITPYNTGNRIARIYKADDVSKTGAETLVFDNTNITGLISGTPYYIIVSTDAVFDNLDEFQLLTEIGATGVFYVEVALTNNTSTYFTISDNPSDVALPIELLSFNLNITNDNNVAINWVTASETNNDYFEIQRSGNGEEWKVLFEIDGAGNSTTKKSYEVVDNTPLSGISYYRLKCKLPQKLDGLEVEKTH